MSNLIYWRMAGYVFALCLHGVNSIVIHYTLRPHKTQELKDIDSLMWQLFTVWNICFQILYSLFGLTCDILTLANFCEKKSALTSLREKIYSYVMWTSGFMVATAFWPLFLYDRSIVYPEYIDEGVPPRSNYVMHAWILVVLLWEFVHLPRSEKISHKTGVTVGSVMFVCYFTWVIYSHSVTGLWPYPFLKMIYGTIYFPIVLLGFYFVMLICYFHQWPLVKLVWGKTARKVD